MKPFIGPFTWCIFLLLAGLPWLQSHWEGALVVFAALVLVPLGFELLKLPWQNIHWIAVFSLLLAYLLYPNPYAAILALPYLAFSAWTSLQFFIQVFSNPARSLGKVVECAALIYWTVGAVWSLCWLAQFAPLGFDATIVGLTAAHFHLAGFALTLIIALLYQSERSALNRILAWASLFGMPLVATGITLTKLGYSPVMEWIAGIGFAVMALGVVFQQLRLVFNANMPPTARWLWGAGALCLCAGATLASLYALRFVYPIDWVNIPNMKIWHGSLNTLGFAWASLSGWAYLHRMLSTMRLF